MHQPLAIVGIGCRFPGGAVDPDSLWRLLTSRTDAISEVPADRWDLRRFYHPDVAEPGKTNVRRGGFLKQSPYEFDAPFFGLSSREASIVDPQQRLLLEATWEAFEDAGQDCARLRGRPVGVFVGGFNLDNLIDRLGITSRDYISQSTATSGTMVMLSNRLSHAFDFVGPSLSVDTACSSSLVAAHLACSSLWAGESEIAIAAGVNVMLAPEPFIAMTKGGFLSSDGRCKAFDAAANGYARAEGVGVVVLKPLAAALDAGDRVYACVLATGVNQDGRTPGISMPNPYSQRKLIRQVLRDSGLSGPQIAYAEAHGTGTQAGDPVEASSLGAEIGFGRAPNEALWVGSIKTNIGHAEAAAGVAGLIKAALVLHHRTVPPNLHFRTANPNIDLHTLGLRVPIEPQPLDTTEPLYAAVNSFGYGGTNAHAILGTPPTLPQPEIPEAESAVRLYPVSARDDEALTAFASSVADMVAAGTTRLQDLGHMLAQRRTHHPARAAVWARSPSELCERLHDLRGANREGWASLGRAPEQPRRLLLVYTGMGAQYVGMGRELFATQPAFREAIERCDAIIAPLSGRSLVEVFAGGSDQRLVDAPIGAPRDAQLPNLAMQVGLTELWRSFGIEPQGAIGHSVGEIGAAWSVGALTLDEALRLTCHRGEAFQRLVGQGSMMAIGLGLAATAALLNGRGDEVSVSAILAPDSVVVAGPPPALDRLASELAEAGVFHRRLHVDVAYHHAQVDLIENDLRARFGAVAYQAPRLPLYSTLYGARVAEACHDADYWYRGTREPADFASAMTAALADGFDAMLEIGPNRVLSAAVRSCASAAGASVWTGASVVRSESEVQQFRRTLADMYVQGVPIGWAAQHSNGRFTRLPRYPWQRQRLWTEAPETRASRSLGTTEALLHQRLDEPSAAWRTDLSSTLFPYLMDHVVAGAVLFPAAGHVAALLAASRALGRGNSIDNLRFERPLALTHPTSLRIDIEESTGTAIVCARGAREDTWMRHATGRLGLARAPRRNRLDLDQCRQSATQRMTADALYAALAERGLTYGPTFRAVREAWFSAKQLVASLALPDGVALDDPLHPVLLDAGFQALAVIAAPEDGQGPLVPVSVNEVRLHGTLDSTPWVVADLTQRTPNSFTASLAFCDAEGNIVAEIEGVRCQRLPTAETPLLTRAAFVDQWERAPVSNLERGSAQAWLFVADEEDELARAVANELSNHGHECRRIGSAALAIPGTAAGMDGIVWFAPTNSVGDAGLAVSTSLLEAVQHILRESDTRPRLVIVTRGAEGRTPRPEHAALWGLARVAATENPSLSVTVVDCEDDERVPSWLAVELLGDSVESEVRLGSEGRLVPRLQPWSVPQPQPEMVDVTDVVVALRQARPGVQDSLVWHEVGRSEPGPGELEIRSVAAALNFKDVLKTMNLLSGAYLENTFFGDTLGMETAGVVTRVGSGVTGFAPGDKVVSLGPAFASYHVVKTSHVCRQPARLLPTEAPVFMNYVTAYHGLVEVGRLQRGERVLIHLASGGVGQAAISIARMVGAEIIATAGNANKRAYLKAQGIEHVFDSRSLDFADRVMEITNGAGVDVVLNSLAGEALRRSWDILAPYGRFIEIGKRDIEENSALPMRHFDKNRSYAALDADRMMQERFPMFRRIVSDVERLFADGRIEPIPVTVFPAAQILEAFHLMSRARHIGKVVVDFRDQKVPALRLPPPRVRKDRTYLVTGAFGGFGRALVRWLAREDARHLVLAGRRGPATEQDRAMVAELQAEGVRVDARALDVADLGMVEKLLTDIRHNGPPLGGIFHLAMVLDDALLPSLDARRLAAVMQPKAVGAWHLHRASAGDPLDHFVLFSSVAQVVGNIGQGAYCAANAFLDGLARRRRAEGLPGLSIAWGVLRDAGVAARGDGLVEQLERLGIRAFTTARALEALGQLMDNSPATITFAEVDWQRWASHTALAATPRFNQLVESSMSGDRLAAFGRELAEHPPAERLGVLHAQLAVTLGALLGIPADRIPLDRSFDDLGVDSLMAVELSASFEEKTGVKLSTSLLMQRATVTAIAAHVLNEILATNHFDEMALDEPSEAETGALLEQLAAPGE